MASAPHPRSLANLKPFKPGNKLAVKHGGYRQLKRDELDAKAAALYDAIATDAPLKENGEAPPADAVVTGLLVDVLCRLDNVREYHVRRGYEDERGNLRRSVEIEQALRREAARYCSELGMSPTSRAKLGVDLVHAENAFERCLRERRERAEAAEAGDGSSAD